MPGKVARARRDARELRRIRPVRIAARTGYVAQALLRLLIGVLALQLALRRHGTQTDASGAFGLLARVPGGVVLLAAVAIGEFALCAWLVVAGLITRGTDLHAWRMRAVHLGRAVVYGTVGTIATRFALGAHEDSARADRESSRHLLDVPGGPLVLGAIGLIIAITGLSLAWLGASGRFRVTVHLPRHAARRRLVTTVGAVGYVGRGVTITVAGVLLVVAAVTLDPRTADGLAGALGGFAVMPLGRVVLVALAAGWLAAAAYGIVRAFLARLDR